MINVFDVCFSKEDKRLELAVKSAIEENPLSYPLGGDEYDPTYYYGYMCNHFNMDTLLEEHGYMITFDDVGDPLGIFEISHGDPITTGMDCRMVMERVLLIGAKYFMIFHNHPRDFAGDTVSILGAKDELVTRNIVMMGLVMGTPCVDHIIIGTNNCEFMSMAEDTSVFQEEMEMYLNTMTLKEGEPDSGTE